MLRVSTDWALPAALHMPCSRHHITSLDWASFSKQIVFFILRVLQEGHTLAAEAANAEGQQQDTAITL
jgi:hypothetical protein